MGGVTVLRTNSPLNPSKENQKKPKLPKTEASTSKLFFAALTGITIFAGIGCLVMSRKVTSLPLRQRLALSGQLFGIAASICSEHLHSPKKNPKKSELPKTEALTSKLFFAALAGISTFAALSFSVIAEKVTSPPLKQRLVLLGQLFTIASSICSVFYAHAYRNHWNQVQ